ncbi:phospholipid-binding protein MlaC [Vibrio cincinnatiensis]|uniref:MlaC/ttg2D family ABC transporter substrate-binding protein n=1 Tax=Vibrio cincinnatiensis TaxID=675 RepID=UPI001EDE8EA5|nr:phospholipid-binding protein MlaC [Vibrio cincinnatiensis]MCG3742954.1 phospholipid-binding protein MlaC [Vibrio cincinnatiensis]
MLKRSMILVMTLFWSWFTTAQVEIDKTNPYLMMKEVAQISFDRLKADQGIIRDNPDHLKVIVEDELMPYINEQYAALKLLGPHLKGAKREDVGTFIQAFRAYLVTSYAQVLTQYTDQEIVFGPEVPLPDDRRIASIKVEIIDSPRPNINLEFKLRKEREGDWKAFDMIAEGISLLSSKQSEWSGKIRQEGILAVAKELQSLADQPIRFESNH